MSANESTYALEQYPDPSALIGGYANYPLSYPHIIEVVGHTGKYGWPQTIQYSGSPVSGTIYSASNVTYDKNTLPTIDIYSGKYKRTASNFDEALIPPLPTADIPGRVYQPSLPYWKIALIGGLSATAIGLLVWYLYLSNNKKK